MKPRAYSTIFGACALICALSVAAWGGSPPELRGKSIIVTWRESRVHRGDPSAASRVYAIDDNLNLSVYIGAQGRIFSRLTHNIVGGGSGAVEEVAGEAGKSKRVLNFNGASLTIVEPFIKGAARRISVAFAPGYSGCTAEAVYGKRPGTEVAAYWSPVINDTIYIQSVSVGEASCSMRDGNVFAGQ